MDINVRAVQEITVVECKGPPNPFVQGAAGCGPAFPGVGLALPRQGG